MFKNICFKDFFNGFSKKVNEWTEWKIITWIILSSMFFRLITLQFVEKSGDAVHTWSVLRCFIDTGNWYLENMDHHVLRWGTTLPVMAIQEVFGTSVFIYYIFPVIVSSITAILVYKVTTHLTDKTIGILAFLVFLVFPLTVRGATQYLPMLPASMFVLSAFLFLFKWFEKEKLYYIACTGLMIILAYGCKITSLYWAVAIALSLLIFSPVDKGCFKIWKFKVGPAVILFSLVIIAGIIIETLILNVLFGASYGRLQLISKTHDFGVLYSFWEWLISFLRPMSMKGKYFDTMPTAVIILLGLISAFFWLRKGTIEKKFIAFSFFIAYFFHSYMIKKVFPFYYPEKSHGRYFLVLTIFCIIFYVGSQPQWNSLLWNRVKNLHVRAFLKFVVVALWLVPSIIYICNTRMWDGNLLDVILMHKNIKVAEADNTPVLYRLEDELEDNKLASSDRKRIQMLLTCFGPSSEIPLINQKKFPLIKNKSGKDELIILNYKASESPIEYSGLSINIFKSAPEKFILPSYKLKMIPLVEQ
ncbi:MAG: hypothetical protein GY750_15295 [Lentisphaerae bacterium]|nr:hypothetical protein [Lentisphaerota bacterium]MCP4102763.1 hypothetical protein [Lentisphaerota bacterium]